MDEEFLDLIDQAFLEGQIDGETMELAFLWIESNRYMQGRYADLLEPNDNRFWAM